MAVTSKYQPFSFQERITPLLMMKEEYDKLNESLIAEGEKATQYYQLLDPETRQAVDAYNSSLNSIAGELSANGLKAVSRNTLYGLRRQYNESIKPINDAAKTLSEMYNKQRDLALRLNASGQELFTSGLPTVKELMENPNAAPHNVSSGALYTQGVNAANSASMREFSRSAFGSRIIRGYIENVQKQGYSPELVAQFRRDMQSIPELAEAYANIKNMYGTATLQNPDKADAFILQGILDGIKYTETYSYNQDIIGAEARAEARAIRAYQRELNKIRLKAALSGKDKGSNTAYTSPMISKADYDTTYKSFVDKKTGAAKIPDSFFKDGKLSKPENTAYNGPYSGPSYNNSTDLVDYNRLINMLSNYYSSEEIANMTKQDVERAVRSIAGEESFDGQRADQYVWRVKGDATNELISTINNIGEVREIKDRDTSGKFIYGKRQKLDIKKGENSELRYDPIANEIILRYQGTYYSVPKSVLPTEMLQTITDYTSPQFKDGKELPSKIRQHSIDLQTIEENFANNNIDLSGVLTTILENGIDPNEVVYKAEAKLKSGQKLDSRESLIYQASKYLVLREDLNNADNVFGGIGDYLNSYTGIANTNK